MFLTNNNKDLAVLESKFQIYEELSKEMLDKLERAVATISENSNRICLILERHQMKLDEYGKTDEAILKLMEKAEDRIDEVEKKVASISRFRWITVGIAIAAMSIIQSSDFFGKVLTLQVDNATVEVQE
jgi:hypothetical protein